MFYNLKYNLCGVWNPKTGTSSMRDLLYRQDFIHNDLKDYSDTKMVEHPKQNCFLPDYLMFLSENDPVRKSPFHKVHIKLSHALFILHKGVGRGIFKDKNFIERSTILKNATYFSSVRNPWSRIVSYSKMKYREGERIVKNKEPITRPDEKIAVELYQKYGDDIGKYIGVFTERLRPQSTYWKLPIPRGYNVFPYCVFEEPEEINITIMTQENLQEDFNSLCNQIGVKPIALPHENVAVYENNDRDYRRYFETKENEYLIEKIKIKEQDTIELKSYTYD